MEPWREANDASWDEAQDALFAAGLGDGLPLAPPTRERIERMLGAAGVERAGVVGVLAPAYAPATWEQIAYNAVLAGCRPEHLRVVGAAVAAVAADEFNLLGIATTTGSAATLAIVNGPIAATLGMNAAGNALGPGNRANATIGRALRLTLQNVGGARPGETDMATLGQPAKFGACFAENEAASPWPSLAVERGFAADASVVTVAGISGSVEIVDSDSAGAEDLALSYAQSMLIAGNVGASGWIGGGEPLIVLPPEHAETFQRAGCSKRDVKKLIFERALLPLERLPSKARARLDAKGVNAARIAASADDVMIVVAGGVGRKGAYLPTWSGGTRAVSRAVAW